MWASTGIKRNNELPNFYIINDLRHSGRKSDPALKLQKKYTSSVQLPILSQKEICAKIL